MNLLIIHLTAYSKAVFFPSFRVSTPRFVPGRCVQFDRDDASGKVWVVARISVVGLPDVSDRFFDAFAVLLWSRSSVDRVEAVTMTSGLWSYVQGLVGASPEYFP